MKEKLDIHQNIIQKLDYFIETKKVPHIIFHGPSGAGKRTIIYNFIDKIYTTKFLKQNYVMFVIAHMERVLNLYVKILNFLRKVILILKMVIYLKV